VRILWLSNAPWVPSGYGEQTRQVAEQMQADGHTVAVACNFGLQGSQVAWHGTTCYPSDGVWGNDTLGVYADDHRADLVIALCDAWVLQPDRWPFGLEVAVWAPVDHEPLPPAVRNVLGHEQVTPVAMSRFGERMMQDAGLDPLFVPHGIDTGLFQPRPELRDQVRDELEIPRDAFLAGMVAANVGNPSVIRKGWPAAFEAFSRFADAHGDAFLYAHSHSAPSPARGGISLDKLADAVGCRPGSVRFPNDRTLALGVDREQMAALYQAFDCLLMVSMGEGFGVPLIEAEASGVPVITSDHSSMPELVGAGWPVAGDPWWDALQDSFLHAPSHDAVHEALEAAYTARGDQLLRRRAVAFAADYDADTVYSDYWKPALEALAGSRLAVVS
jgi:glycosyltransferase involved in cell wall biosynthesis